MEKLKVKHDHTLTDIIKVAIFALFLILPVLVFLPNCLYYGFNEHATNTETTTINYKYESNEVDNRVDNLIVGNIYHFDIQNDLLSNNLLFNLQDSYLQCAFINIEKYNFYGYDLEFDDSIFESYEDNGILTLLLSFYPNNTSFSFYLTFNENNDSFYTYTVNLDSTFTFVGDFIYLESYEIDFDNENFVTQSTYNVIESVSVNTDDTITDKVATAWGRMWETPMLSWTDTNTFKFTINAFVTVFGITQESYLANYLTYILVVTCIYLIFDIVLTLTTKLTHLINEK